MKLLKYTVFIVILSSIIVSCRDKNFLQEDLRSRFTTSNAFLNYAQFQTGLNQMYSQARAFYNSADGTRDWVRCGIGTDVILSTSQENPSYSFWNTLNPQTQFPADMYNRNYQMIKNCNELLVQTENPNVVWTNDDQKKQVQAEIRFFRGFAYRILGSFFGGVPIVLQPVTSPKLDFTRATRLEVYQVADSDLTFAAQYLPINASLPGKVVRAAADHFLSEVNISLGDETKDKSYYTKAIDAATRVIDGTDGDYSLMKSRFGTRASEPGKDAYWDLFRMGNQNYQDGNKESIWTIQFAQNLPGGTNIYDRPLFERAFWPNFWNSNKFGFSSPAWDWTGRGVASVRPNNYFKYNIWSDDSSDIRNAPDNIQRIYVAPKVIVNGIQTNNDTIYTTSVTLANGSQIQVKLHPGDTIRQEWLTTLSDTMTSFYPRIWKMGTDKHINAIPDNGYVRDAYVIRLAETYLLRAEAYMKAGDNVNAAADINVVRERANAEPVLPSDVNIDYILDERARELYGEEWRMLTLSRLGLIYDRTKRFGLPADAGAVHEYNNLLPIPQSAIDANLENKLQQNPGY